MTLHGQLVPVPGVAYFANSRVAFEKCKAEFFDLSDQPRSMKPLPGLGGVRQVQLIEPLLTWAHERCHYVQNFTTDFGHLLWQVEVFLQDQAIAQFRKSLGTPTGLEPATDAARHRVRAFYGALTRTASLTMQEFLDLANFASGQVAAYWGTSGVTWSARDPDALSYLPTWSVTGREVLEGAARIGELLLLSPSNFTLQPGLLHEWFATKLSGDYKAVAARLIGEVGDLMAAATIADEALMGRVHLLSADHGVEVFVEDVLPQWRLAAMLTAAPRLLFPNNLVERIAYCREELAEHAGIPSSRATLEGRTPRAWPTQVPDGGLSEPLFDSQFRRYCQERFAQSEDLRRAGNSLLTVATDEDAEAVDQMGGYQPLLEVFSDDVASNNDMRKDEPEILLKCYTELVRAKVGDALMQETFSVSGFAVLDSFVARLVEATSLNGAGLDVRSAASRIIGRDSKAVFTF